MCNFDTDTGTGIETSGTYNWIVNNQYKYHSNDNCITKDTLAGIQNFAYDSQNRLVQAEYPTYTESFYYDRAGNRTRYTGNGIETEYGSGNRLTEMVSRREGIEEVTKFENNPQGLEFPQNVTERQINSNKVPICRFLKV
jgi:hypothetical protein